MIRQLAAADQIWSLQTSVLCMVFTSRKKFESHPLLQVLFGFGWVTGITWLLGFVLPMCSYQRLKVPSYRCIQTCVS